MRNPGAECARAALVRGRRAGPRELEHDANGRPILQGRRDVPLAERRQVMIAYVERVRGQPWTGTDARCHVKKWSPCMAGMSVWQIRSSP